VAAACSLFAQQRHAVHHAQLPAWLTSCTGSYFLDGTHDHHIMHDQHRMFYRFTYYGRDLGPNALYVPVLRYLVPGSRLDGTPEYLLLDVPGRIPYKYQ
jgi:hypothetical protein